MTRYVRTLALRRALRAKEVLELVACEAHEAVHLGNVRTMFERSGTSELVEGFERYQLAFFREREGE